MERLHQHRPKTARRYAAAVTWRLAFREKFNHLRKPDAAMSGGGVCTHRSASATTLFTSTGRWRNQNGFDSRESSRRVRVSQQRLIF